MLMAQLSSAAKKIEKLKYELAILKGMMSLPPLLFSWKPFTRKLVV